MMEKEGLTAPKESKAVITGEVLPFREPKSCENPPIPMLSSLGWVEHVSWSGYSEKERKVACQTIDPCI